MPPVGVL